jgi:hypothetical protein
MSDVMPHTSRPPDPRALSESRQRVREKVFAAVASDAERARPSGVVRKNIAKSLARLDDMDLFARDEDSELEQPSALAEEKKYHFIMSFLEVEGTLQRMNDLEYYFRRYPFAGTPVTKIDHIRISIEIYLNEIYIYRCRIKNLLNSTQDACGSKIETFWRAFKQIDGGLKDVTRTRNWNVHNRRFSDDDINLLDLLNLLSGRGELFEMQLDFAYKEIRKKWVALVRRNAEELTKAFESICWLIEPYLEQALEDDAG